MSDAELRSTVDRVVAVIRAAAREALDAGAAELFVSDTRSEWGPSVMYDWPVVVLKPREPAAARVRVEIGDPEEWVLSAGDGPPFEFYAGMREDRDALLTKLVAAVVRGDYEHGYETESFRRWLPPWTRKEYPVRVARFGVGEDAIRTGETGAGVPPPTPTRHFEPYM